MANTNETFRILDQYEQNYHQKPIRSVNPACRLSTITHYTACAQTQQKSSMYGSVTDKVTNARMENGSAEPHQQDSFQLITEDKEFARDMAGFMKQVGLDKAGFAYNVGWSSSFDD